MKELTEEEEIKRNMKLTRAQSMKLKCEDCMGGYIDGRVSCCIPSCPLFKWMPYRKKVDEDFEKDYPEVMEELTRKKKSTKKLSPEHLKAMQEGRKKKKENK